MPPKRPRLAVILTSYGATSHGLCFCTKFLEGKQYDDHFEEPRCEVVAIHQMEITKDDIGVATAKKHGVPMYHSVAAALCRGGNELAVDGVVLIGEHGSWPFNEKGQQLYPRRELFDQIAGVFRQSRRVVPIFNDKHLSWNWEWAKHMWRTAQELKIPFMAGSSLPYAKYEPLVSLPRGKKLDHLIAVGYAGLESYGFHSIETGQFVVESRAGGEVGVKSVQCLEGQAVWDAHRDGRWPQDIAAAALAAVQEPRGRPEDYTKNVYAIDIEYRDGQRMTVLMPNGYCAEFGFAYRERGSNRIVSTAYKLDPVPRLKHFSATVRSLEDMYLTGKPTEPGERTLLTTGILAYAIESHHRGGVKLETPDLNIRYKPPRRPESWREVVR
ncbi:MAG: hypothetical protein ACK47B_17625 [Armatimonadota bacterium]